MLRAGDQIGELEDRILGELDLSYESFGFLKSHPGSRRPLRLPVTGAEVVAEPGGLRVRFELPSGSYATSLLRQVLESPPWFGA